MAKKSDLKMWEALEGTKVFTTSTDFYRRGLNPNKILKKPIELGYVEATKLPFMRRTDYRLTEKGKAEFERLNKVV